MRVFLSLLTCLCLCACAHMGQKPYEDVYKSFPADKVSKPELDALARDMNERSKTNIAILVKYNLSNRQLASQDLALDQAETVRNYLVQQGVKQPIAVFTSPVALTPVNEIWISYRAIRKEDDTNKDEKKPVVKIKTQETFDPVLPLPDVKKPEIKTKA